MRTYLPSQLTAAALLLTAALGMSLRSGRRSASPPAVVLWPLLFLGISLHVH
jgi:hypothetical protein